MRGIVICGLLAGCAAQGSLSGAPPAAPQAARPACLAAYQIDHTDVPDDTAILFTMRDHSVYRAAIEGPCVGLARDPGGFTYAPEPGNNEICANLFTIRTNTTHQTCLVGAITRLERKK